MENKIIVKNSLRVDSLGGVPISRPMGFRLGLRLQISEMLSIYS